MTAECVLVESRHRRDAYGMLYVDSTHLHTHASRIFHLLACVLLSGFGIPEIQHGSRGCCLLVPVRVTV